MRKIVMLLSVTAVSWVGWLMGEPFGLMTAYLCSFVGSLGGVVLASWFNRNYLD